MDETTTPGTVEALELDAGRQLLHATCRYMRRNDEPGLARYLRTYWTPNDLARVLTHSNDAVVASAAIALGLVGTKDEIPALARALHHDDFTVVDATERAMWMIWFSASSLRCCELLWDVIARINRSEFEEADRQLDQILVDDADFAEACNQRAILYYLTGRHELSIMACHRTLSLNPYHFGAQAGLGHNLVQLGRYDEAIEAYHRALRMHPRMEGVRQAMRTARELAAGRPIDTTALSPSIEPPLKLHPYNERRFA